MPRKRSKEVQALSSLNVYLARIARDRLGRFVEIKNLKSCSSASCDLDSIGDETLEQTVLELDAFLETLEDLAAATDPGEAAALQQIVRDYRLHLRDDQAVIFREQDRREAAQLRAEASADLPADLPAFIDSSEVDAVDVTGLEGREASRLALRLAEWNPGVSRVYSKRNGRRYLHRDVKSINLTDPLVVGLGLADDLWPVVQERGLTVYHEDAGSRRARRRDT